MDVGGDGGDDSGRSGFVYVKLRNFLAQVTFGYADYLLMRDWFLYNLVYR